MTDRPPSKQADVKSYIARTRSWLLGSRWDLIVSFADGPPEFLGGWTLTPRAADRRVARVASQRFGIENVFQQPQSKLGEGRA